MTERHAEVIALRPEKREEYLALHRAVWPEVEQRLRAANFRNYTIFLHGDLLFAYYEYAGTDLAADRELIAADPATRRWWELTDPCQRSLAGDPDGPWWTPLPQVWHLSDEP